MSGSQDVCMQACEPPPTRLSCLGIRANQLQYAPTVEVCDNVSLCIPHYACRKGGGKHRGG